MSAFFKQLFWFSLLAFLLIGFVHLGLQHRMEANSNYKIDTAIHTIILGNSRPECAFDDSLIANTRNLSLVAEPYFYTFFKLRKLLKANPQIQTVLMEFSDINLTEENMQKWLYDAASIKYLYPKYANLMSLSEKATVFKINPVAAIKSFPFVLRDNVLATINRNHDMISYKQWGGYMAKEGSHLDSTLRKTTSSEVSPKKTITISNFNLQYLDSMITLCKQHQIKLYLLRAPVHSSYGLASFDATYDSILQHRYPNEQLIDFANYKLSNEDFFDPHHLNYQGARIVSKRLDSVIHLLHDSSANLLFVNHRLAITD